MSPPCREDLALETWQAHDEHCHRSFCREVCPQHLHKDCPVSITERDLLLQVGEGRTELGRLRAVRFHLGSGHSGGGTPCWVQPGEFLRRYLKGKGFVGVGKIASRAAMVRPSRSMDGVSLVAAECQRMGEKSDDPVRSEYICPVEWDQTSRERSKRRKTPKLYTLRMSALPWIVSQTQWRS